MAGRAKALAEAVVIGRKASAVLVASHSWLVASG